jgi:serine/threonine protein kinase
MPEKLGRYEIVREVGHGAMGVVYEALDPTIGRKVALKAIRFDAIGTTADEAARRFKNEARAAGGLSHPNIVTVYDAGEDGGNLYLAMEFIDGTTLESVLKAERRLSPARTLEIIRQVCAGLDSAHKKGIVHRDVKPGNVMISGDGVVKITDFGIARAGEVMTMTGQVVGTPNYMSPEQVVGNQLDGRSDLFSVGVMLYEMITGERPFEGQSITTIMYKIVHETPVPPVKLDSSIHPSLSFVIEKALQKSPDTRFQNGAELTQALENYKTADVATLTSLGVPTTTAPVLGGTTTAGGANAVGASGTSGSTGQSGASSGAISAEGSKATPGSSASIPAPAPSSSAVVQLFDRGVALWSGLSRKGKRRLIYVLIAVFFWAKCEFGGDRSRRASRDEESQTASSSPGSAQPPSSNQKPASKDADQSTGEPSVSVPAPNPPSPATAPAVVTKHESAADDSTHALLKIASDPPTAVVLLDGKPTGKRTPADLQLPRGKHTITVQMEGFIPATASFRVQGGEEMEYSPHLTVNTGNIKVPNITLPDLSNLEGMTKAAQANAWRQWAQAQTGNAKELVINSSPPGAKVLVDGKDTGKQTPATIPMEPGTYHVRVELEDFLPQEKDLTIGEHKPGVANFRLKPKVE